MAKTIPTSTPAIPPAGPAAAEVSVELSDLEANLAAEEVGGAKVAVLHWKLKYRFTKGRPDPLEPLKMAAAERWVKAVNADGRYGRWQYAVARRPEEARRVIEAARQGPA